MRRSLPKLLIATLTLWLAAGPGCADEAQGETPPAPVPLDALFRLPPAAPQTTPSDGRIGGATREVWEERFRAARSDVEDHSAALKRAQAELGEMASGADSWQIAAPGAPAGAENSPLSYKLRQEIRRQREELAAAEARLDELRIEANFAGVPEEWQGLRVVEPASDAR
jgi:hypothetical protein